MNKENLVPDAREDERKLRIFLNIELDKETMTFAVTGETPTPTWNRVLAHALLDAVEDAARGALQPKILPVKPEQLRGMMRGKN